MWLLPHSNNMNNHGLHAVDGRLWVWWFLYNTHSNLSEIRMFFIIWKWLTINHYSIRVLFRHKRPCNTWNPGPGYNTLLLRLILGNSIVDAPVDSFTHYSAFFTFRLYCQTPTVVGACQAEMHCVIFMSVSGMTRLGANPRPTTWEEDT